MCYYSIDDIASRGVSVIKLIIASNNKHKITEIKEILSPYFSEILSLSEAGISHETIEDGTTFYENSRKKALEIAAISGCGVVADDSGICVDALDGLPGIYSARFSGEHGNDALNNELLLSKLQGVENRAAHYTCCVVLITPDGKEYTAEDYMYGNINYAPQGDGGFGYDPIFVPDGYDITLARLTAKQKNEISHRAKAFRKLAEILDGLDCISE